MTDRARAVMGVPPLGAGGVLAAAAMEVAAMAMGVPETMMAQADAALAARQARREAEARDARALYLAFARWGDDGGPLGLPAWARPGWRKPGAQLLPPSPAMVAAQAKRERRAAKNLRRPQ